MRELMALPFIMGGISLLIWFSLPTADELRAEYAPEIGQRLEWVARATQRLPRDGHAGPAGCAERPSPAPVRISGDETRSNTEVLSGDDLRDFGLGSPLAADVDFYTRGQLGYLMYWHLHPPYGGSRRMGKDRTDTEILAPLATRYLVLYGVEDVGRNRLRVDAFLFDFANSRLVCEFGFEADAGPVRFRGEAAQRFVDTWAEIAGARFEFSNW